MQLLTDGFVSRLKRIAADRPHAVLVEGVNGHSARYEAGHLAQLMVGTHGGLQTSITKPSDKTVIGIDQVQQLYQSTRSKRAAGIDVLVVQDAELLSEAAQNAFLKLLEEPPAAAVFVLSVSNSTEMLQTIKSRCIVVRSARYDDSRARQWLAVNRVEDESLSRQLLFLADGSTSELQSLVKDEAYRSRQLAAAADAKLLFGGETFDKIVLIARLSAKRELMLEVVRMAMRMAAITLQQEPGRSDLLKRLQALASCHEQLSRNGNVRVQGLNAVLGGS